MIKKVVFSQHMEKSLKSGLATGEVVVKLEDAPLLPFQLDELSVSDLLKCEVKILDKSLQIVLDKNNPHKYYNGFMHNGIVTCSSGNENNRLKEPASNLLTKAYELAKFRAAPYLPN